VRTCKKSSSGIYQGRNCFGMIADPTSWPQIADALSRRAVERDEVIAPIAGRGQHGAQTHARTDVALDYERIGIDMRMLFNDLAIE
jgi:hypothetical protein